MIGPDDAEEERVVFGRLTPEPGRVRVQVSSQRRLKQLLRILKEIGAVPEVTEESHAEPSLDFAWGPVPDDRLTARQCCASSSSSPPSPAERGGRPVDTAWLRAEVGLEPTR